VATISLLLPEAGLEPITLVMTQTEILFTMTEQIITTPMATKLVLHHQQKVD
jgi:hypothetical protein